MTCGRVWLRADHLSEEGLPTTLLVQVLKFLKQLGSPPGLSQTPPCSVSDQGCTGEK